MDDARFLLVLIDSRKHVDLVHGGRSTFTLTRALTEQSPQNWRVLAIDAREAANVALNDIDVLLADTDDAFVRARSVTKFCTAHSPEPVTPVEWRAYFDNDDAVDGENVLLLDLKNDPRIAAVLWRLPRRSDAFNQQFVDRMRLNGRSVVLINDPVLGGVCGSKRFLTSFTELCPDLALCSTLEDVTNFHAKHRASGIVLKPLCSHGGYGLIRIDSNDAVWCTGTEITHKSYQEFMNDSKYADDHVSEDNQYLAMRFLKNIDQGDKRLIVVGGEIVGASLRIPKQDSWLCNASQGASSHPSQPTIEETEIVKQLDPVLQERNVFFYGVDTLVNDDGKRILSEINCVSIGGILPLEIVSKQPIVARTARALWKLVCEQAPKRQNRN